MIFLQRAGARCSLVDGQEANGNLSRARPDVGSAKRERIHMQMSARAHACM